MPLQTTPPPRRWRTPEERLSALFADMARPPVQPAEPVMLPTPEQISAEELEFFAQVPASVASLRLLLKVDPAGLSDEGPEQFHYLQACDRLTRLVAALTNRALVAITGTEALTSATFRDAQGLEKEIAVARGTGPIATATAVAVAKDLATVFTATAGALEQGRVSEGHVRVLCERTGMVSDPAIRTRIQDQVLAKASSCTAHAFAKVVDAAVCTHDADNARDRHQRAEHTRRVEAYRDADAMGSLTVHDTWSRIHAMKTRIDAEGRQLQLARGGATAATNDPDAYLDTCRADALAAMILGTDAVDVAPTDVLSAPGPSPLPAEPAPAAPREPREPVLTGQLVIDVRTLQGLNENFALLDGSPIPASIGRDLARGIRNWRRMVTDPVTGHLLDYGRDTYLPEPLLRYIGARDGICRAPYCNAPESRSQVDHARPWSGDGRSDTVNTGLLCTHTDHALKTDKAFWTITDRRPDGSAAFTSSRGQVFAIPARPFLHDPDPPSSHDPPARARAPLPDPADDDPPF